MLAAPEVFAAYAPARVRGDLLVGDHWIFFKLRDAEWFAERLQEPEPDASGDASPEELRPLRALDWGRMAAPYRSGP